MSRSCRAVLLIAAWSAAALSLAGCPWGHGSKQLGEPCRVNNECAGVRCTSGHGRDDASRPRDPSWVCTQACTSDADCVTSVRALVCQIPLDPAGHPAAHGVCVVK